MIPVTSREASLRLFVPRAFSLVLLGVSALMLGVSATAAEPIAVEPGPPADFRDPASAGLGRTMTRLDLDVTVDAPERRFLVRGTARLRLDLAESFGPTLAVNLKRPVMRWVALEAPAGASVETDVVKGPFPSARFADVRFDEKLERGAEVELRFELHSRGRADQLVAHPEFAMASWTEAWYPFAPPRLDLGEGFTSNLLAVPGTTTLRLPSEWLAHSDGVRERSESTEAGTVEVFSVGREGSDSMARSFVAGRYRREARTVDGREVAVCLLGEHAISVDALAEKIGAVMKAQETRLGPFPFPSYGVTEAPNPVSDAWYASSQQSFIVAKSAAFGYEHGNLPLWAHEMCHAWWGNTVITDGPGQKMCGEALAQVGALIAIETLEGRDAMIEFLEHSRSGYSSAQCARGYFGMLREGTDHALSRLGTSGLDGDVTHNLADSKGMWVYHMLRQRIGDEAFFGTLRALVDRFSHRRMTLEDVRAAFVEAAPDAGLERFFEQWFDRTGAPVLDVAWKPSGQGVFEVSVTQAQDGAPYVFDLDVELVFADGSTRREELRLAREATTLEVHSNSAIDIVRLDPDRDLLLWRESYGPRP